MILNILDTTSFLNIFFDTLVLNKYFKYWSKLTKSLYMYIKPKFCNKLLTSPKKKQRGIECVKVALYIIPYSMFFESRDIPTKIMLRSMLFYGAAFEITRVVVKILWMLYSCLSLCLLCAVLACNKNARINRDPADSIDL